MKVATGHEDFYGLMGLAEAILERALPFPTTLPADQELILSRDEARAAMLAVNLLPSLFRLVRTAESIVMAHGIPLHMERARLVPIRRRLDQFLQALDIEILRQKVNL